VRTADDAKNFGGGFLLFARLGKLAPERFLDTASAARGLGPALERARLRASASFSLSAAISSVASARRPVTRFNLRSQAVVAVAIISDTPFA